MVVVHGLRIAVAGTACGLAGAFALTRWMSSLLFGVKPRDPLVFGLVPAILMAVAWIAVWLPAIRASRVDPAEALRHD
jgi:ABC-type lipoprotein release transport system permease subunit